MKQFSILATLLLFVVTSCAQHKNSLDTDQLPSNQKYSININNGDAQQKIYGSDNVISRDIKIKDFKKILLTGCGDVRYEPSSQPRLNIRTSDNIFDQMDIRVEDETLKIGFKKGVSLSLNVLEITIGSPELEEIETTGTCLLTLAEELKAERLKIESKGTSRITAHGIRCQDELEIDLTGTGSLELGQLSEAKEINIEIKGTGSVTAQDLRASDKILLDLSGTGSVNIDGLHTDDLNCNISGTGNLICQDIQAEDTQAKLSGTGSMRLSGTTRNASYSASGTGKVTANELKAETAYAAVSGFGRIQCHAKKQLNTTTSGNGKIYYSGNPEIKHSGTKKPQKL